ncbi:MAG: hypothetical protein FRX48_04178 [Lasallia pustulata]|uniref:Uncharacterized protein n=1 Tax=Lasallia pustulata TaxID=136370 RepID=A0A5M8PSU8_9LECA|nr:MAG: hypothetical protein FRX48_04178 [Lasallia pustulata]
MPICTYPPAHYTLPVPSPSPHPPLTLPSTSALKHLRRTNINSTPLPLIHNTSQEHARPINMIQAPPRQRIPQLKRAVLPKQKMLQKDIAALHHLRNTRLPPQRIQHRKQNELHQIMPNPVVPRRMQRPHDLMIRNTIHEDPVRCRRQGGQISIRHMDALPLEQHHRRMSPRVTLDGVQHLLQPLLRRLLRHQEVKGQMPRYAPPAPGRELVRELEHSLTERRVGRQRFVVHQEFRRGAGHERFDLAFDDDGVRAVFLAADILLQHPRVIRRDGEAGQALVSFADGGAWEKGHIGSGGVIHADAFDNVLRPIMRIQHFMHRRSRSNVVSLRRR